MIRKFGDWTIVVVELEHPNFGRGFRATAYVAKNNGLKADVREFSRFDGIKSHKGMLDYTKKLLSL